MDINMIAKKYDMDTLEDFIAESEEPETIAKILWYESFLKFTDHISIKLLEGSLTTSECADELAAREIAKLNGEQYEPKKNKMTLDERTAILEVDGLESVFDLECRLAMLEAGITE